MISQKDLRLACVGEEKETDTPFSFHNERCQQQSPSLPNPAGTPPILRALALRVHSCWPEPSQAALPVHPRIKRQGSGNRIHQSAGYTLIATVSTMLKGVGVTASQAILILVGGAHMHACAHTHPITQCFGGFSPSNKNNEASAFKLQRLTKRNCRATGFNGISLAEKVLSSSAHTPPPQTA